jgi:hypothetical protein
LVETLTRVHFTKVSNFNMLTNQERRGFIRPSLQV